MPQGWQEHMPRLHLPVVQVTIPRSLFCIESEPVMPKMKTHKSALKRLKITGTGKVKFQHPGKRHCNSHLSGKQMRQRGRFGTATKSDARRLEHMIHQRLSY